MGKIIKIENQNLAKYIMFKLDKLENEFTEEELDKITEVVINYEDESDSSFIFLEDLLKIKKLKSITLRNGEIYNDNYNIFLKLNNLSELVLENCEFEKVELICSLNLKSLSLINCEIKDYTFINALENLEELTIINGSIEINKINKLHNLKYLQISYSNVIDNTKLNIPSLEELYIDNTNINTFEFLKELNNLKTVSIDRTQYNNSKEIFNNLIKNNISVLNESMFEFGGEDNAL